MRTLTIAAILTVFALAGGTMLVNQPAANADNVHQSSIMIDELTANAKNLPTQSFDAF
jgi:hypothetical protein